MSEAIEALNRRLRELNGEAEVEARQRKYHQQLAEAHYVNIGKLRADAVAVREAIIQLGGKPDVPLGAESAISAQKEQNQ